MKCNDYNILYMSLTVPVTILYQELFYDKEQRYRVAQKECNTSYVLRIPQSG